MKIAIVVNGKRQDPNALDDKLLKELAQKYNVKYDIFFSEPAEIATLITQLLPQSYNGFLIAGGDGTVRSAAQVLANHEVPLAILPLGTFNYFARELNFPKDIETIFKIIKNNKLKWVDVGEVNDYVFINHSSIGFYSHVLKLKEKHKEILGKNKLFKIIFTAINFLNVIPRYRLTMEVNGRQVAYETCLVFIGNNYHLTNLLDFGVRKSLSSGVLAVYVFNCKSRWQIIKCIISILFNTFDKPKYLTQFLTNELIIESDGKCLNVVLDGELLKLNVPLIYRSCTKQLAVYMA